MCFRSLRASQLSTIITIKWFANELKIKRDNLKSCSGKNLDNNFRFRHCGEPRKCFHGNTAHKLHNMVSYISSFSRYCNVRKRRPRKYAFYAIYKHYEVFRSFMDTAKRDVAQIV